MGAILYDFPGVPEQPTDDECSAARLAAEGDGTPDELAAADAVLARRQAFRGIYEDLTRRGFAVPATSPDKISRTEMVDHLRGVVTQAIKAELTTDPDDIYPDDAVKAAGKGNQKAAEELSILLNSELAWEFREAKEATEATEVTEATEAVEAAWLSRPATSGDSARRLPGVLRSAKANADHAVSHPIARIARIPHAPNEITAADIIASLRGG